MGCQSEVHLAGVKFLGHTPLRDVGKGNPRKVAQERLVLWLHAGQTSTRYLYLGELVHDASHKAVVSPGLTGVGDSASQRQLQAVTADCPRFARHILDPASIGEAEF